MRLTGNTETKMKITRSQLKRIIIEESSESRMADISAAAARSAALVTLKLFYTEKDAKKFIKKHPQRDKLVVEYKPQSDFWAVRIARDDYIKE